MSKHMRYLAAVLCPPSTTLATVQATVDKALKPFAEVIEAFEIGGELSGSLTGQFGTRSCPTCGSRVASTEANMATAAELLQVLDEDADVRYPAIIVAPDGVWRTAPRARRGKARYAITDGWKRRVERLYANHPDHIAVGVTCRL